MKKEAIERRLIDPDQVVFAYADTLATIDHEFCGGKGWIADGWPAERRRCPGCEDGQVSQPQVLEAVARHLSHRYHGDWREWLGEAEEVLRAIRALEPRR